MLTLLAYTLVALLPPLLAKLAVDQGIKTGDLQKLAWIVVAFVAIGVVAFGLSALQTYLTGWVGERALADLRIRGSFGYTAAAWAQVVALDLMPGPDVTEAATAMGFCSAASSWA